MASLPLDSAEIAVVKSTCVSALKDVVVHFVAEAVRRLALVFPSDDRDRFGPDRSALLQDRSGPSADERKATLKRMCSFNGSPKDTFTYVLSLDV